MERTNVYTDGFNFDYGRIKGPPFRWLDLGAYRRTVFPHNTIHRIKYFTALVKPTPQDLTQQQRQLAPLRALETVPHLSIHYRRFFIMSTWRRLADTPPNDPPRSIKIIHVASPWRSRRDAVTTTAARPIHSRLHQNRILLRLAELPG